MRIPWIKVLPWIITIGVFAIIFSRIPLPEVIAALRQVRLWPYFALMVPYSLIYCLVDSFVLTRAVAWFHRRVPYRRLLPVRASSYILSLLNPGLGQGGVAFYVHRREHIPFLALAGTMLFLIVLEVCQLALYAAIGIAAFYSHLIAAFAPFYIGFSAIIGLGLWLIHQGTAPLEKVAARFGRRLPVSDASLLATLRRARWRHYLLTLLYKAPNFLFAIVLHYFALQLFGVHVPFTRLFALLPVVFLVASLPITVAHLGTSQAAWLYFFSAYGQETQILAYSLVAHVTFMVLNSLIGLAFLPLALQDLSATDAALPASDAPHPTQTPEAPEA
jgi:uncharacterized membrane protein YbhN (UPF0104 family)